MGKIRKLLKAVSMIISKPYLLNLIIENNESFKKKAIKKYNIQTGLKQIDLCTLFPEFEEIVNPFAFLDGGSLPIDIALLKALAKKYSVENYLEIGTWRGESVANMASVVSECYTVNLPDDDIMDFTNNEDYVKAHRFFSGSLNNVKHIAANSNNFDFNTLNTKFDMVFVDGDHHYHSVKKDTQTAFDIVKSDNSIIVWHDYLSHSGEIRWDVLMAILDGCPSGKRGKLFHVSNTLCAAYLPDDIESNDYKPYKQPNKKYIVTIEQKKIVKDK